MKKITENTKTIILGTLMAFGGAFSLIWGGCGLIAYGYSLADTLFFVLGFAVAYAGIEAVGERLAFLKKIDEKIEKFEATFDKWYNSCNIK